MFLTLNKKEFDDFCKTSSKPAWVEVSHVRQQPFYHQTWG